jgi:hypothetical protein
MISVSAMLTMMLIVLADRYRLERLRHELDELRVAGETRPGELVSALAKAPRN